MLLCRPPHSNSRGQLRTRINQVELQRNRQHCTISWQFTTTDARDKLHHLYPDL